MRCEGADAANWGFAHTWSREHTFSSLDCENSGGSSWARSAGLGCARFRQEKRPWSWSKLYGQVLGSAGGNRR